MTATRVSLIGWPVGQSRRRSGAASTGAKAARPRRHFLTTARQASQIGRPGGRWPKRRGVASTGARAARRRRQGVSPPPHPTTARQASQIGRLGGLCPRRLGAARTRARAARRRPALLPAEFFEPLGWAGDAIPKLRHWRARHFLVPAKP